MELDAYKATYENETSYWWYVARSRIIKKIFQQSMPNGLNDILILNLGGGTGYNSQIFSEYGKVVTLDFSGAALSFCKINGLTNLIQGDAQFLSFKEESFDVVLALDLFEHLIDDLKGMQEIQRIIKQTGYILLTVPAYQFMWSGMDDVGKHFRRYTKKELIKKLRRAHLIPLRISYFNFLLFPLAIVERVYHKFIRRKKIDGTNFLPKLPALINIFLKSVFSLEAYLITLFNFPFGLSIIALCYKKEGFSG